MLNIDKIRENLNALGYSAPRLLFYESTDSTNTRAREWSRSHGTAAVFVAASQSAGRGRLGRSFLSETGGIYISFLVYPEEKLSSPAGITAEAAVRMCHAVERASGVSPYIKWVNDLYVNGKKVAGILTEGEFDEFGFLRYYILGMGINVYKIKDFDRIMPIATTLEDNAERDIDINLLCAEIIGAAAEEIPTTQLLSEYRDRCLVTGREVTVIRGGEEYAARAVGITDGYELLVRRDGITEILSSGEVSLRL